MTYFVQLSVSAMFFLLASYIEVPVLSLPRPATLRVAARLALAQKVSAS